jgi:hypothetical protein
MSTRLFIGAASTLLWFVPFADALEDKEELVKRTADAHRSAVESIRTFSCHVDIIDEKDNPNSNADHADYWRSGDMVRIVEVYRSEPRETIVRDGKRIKINRNPKLDLRKDIVATIEAKRSTFHDGVWDPWELGLIRFIGPKNVYYTFDELLDLPRKVAQAKRISENGHEFVYIELEHDEDHCEFWFDPLVNYLISRMVRSWPYAGHKYSLECQVMNFVELSPGIFFAEKIGRRLFDNGAPVDGGSVARLSRMSVNQPIPPDTFTLRFPHGAQAIDNIQNKVILVDSEGRQIGESNLKVSNSPNPLISVGPDIQFATVEEPKSWSRWLLPAALAILVTASLLLVIQRVRQWRSSPAQG